MKKFLVFLLMLSGCSSAAADPNLYQYPFKTVKIEFAEGGNLAGTSTLMIKGGKKITINNFKRLGPYDEVYLNNTFIESGKDIYDINPDTKIAYHTVQWDYDLFLKAPLGDRQKLLTKSQLGISPWLDKPEEIHSLGTENVAGQTCEIYYFNSSSTRCMWNGIPIKTSFHLPSIAQGQIPGDDYTEIATSIQVNIDIPDSAFEVPASITIKQPDA